MEYNSRQSVESRMNADCNPENQSVQITEEHFLGFHLFNLCHRHPTGDIIDATENHFPKYFPSFQMPSFAVPFFVMKMPFPFNLSFLYSPTYFPSATDIEPKQLCLYPDEGHGGKSLANPLPTLPKSAAITRQKVRDRFFIPTHPKTDLPRWYPIHINLWSLD